MDNKTAWQSLIEGDAVLMEKTREQVVKYSLGTENTALYCCILWPGMFLWANDVRDKYLPANEDVNMSFVTINYCLEGRCESGAGGRDVFVYMKPGMLCIDNHRQPDGYHYPSGKYKGIEFAFLKDETQDGFPDALEQIGIHLRDINSMLDAADGTFIGGISEELHGPMAELYDHLISGNISIEECRYCSIRILHGLLHGGCRREEIKSYITKGQRAIANDVEERITADLSRHYVIADLAADYGVSASAVKKYFEAVYGDNITGYLRTRRMELARQMLEDSDLSVGEISSAAGYSHQGKFGKAFKDFTGLAPLEYRRQNYRKGRNHED